MPSERDLAARFEANRGAIRESLKKLEQLGIASITPGGVRVVPVKEASLSVLGPLVDLQESPDPILTGHLLEVLGALLSMAARTAMERASEEELTEMKNIVVEILENTDDTEYQNNRWRDLAMMFTEVSENLVLRLILNGLKTQFINRIEERTQIDFDIKQAARNRIQDQLEAAILRLKSAIEKRDSSEAANAILDHFETINRTFQLAISQVEPQTKQSTSL